MCESPYLKRTTFFSLVTGWAISSSLKRTLSGYSMKNRSREHSNRSPCLTESSCVRVKRLVIRSGNFGSVAALIRCGNWLVPVKLVVVSADSAVRLLPFAKAWNDFDLFRLGMLLNIRKTVASSSSGRPCSESWITCQLWTTSVGSSAPL